VWDLRNNTNQRKRDKQKNQTPKYREQTGGYQRGSRWGGWVK